MSSIKTTPPFLKPPWLNRKIQLSDCRQTKRVLRQLRVYTVCEESGCPNLSECFSRKVATFMILGNICTRHCRFCGLSKGTPTVVDAEEPQRIKEAVKRLGLEYVVITSPTRDDLPDGGANIFCKVAEIIKTLDSRIKVELLIPDLWGRISLLRKIAFCGAEVIAHNLETVPSLYSIRKGANYNRSLKVLERIKSLNKRVFTKSGLMLGLGESPGEVKQVLKDLRSVNCDFLTLGQYLPPSLNHYSLKEYIHPDKFNYFRQYALKLGFCAVQSGPYVRSSYLAHLLLTS